jgi:TetR/AcrR family transcriptional repressor of nem operon
MMTAPERKHAKQHILDTARVIISKKGYSAVGLNEVLSAAHVPKGSFYNYFGSKDLFGVALLDAYFDHYLDNMTRIFERDGLTDSQKLGLYWEHWIDNQTRETDSGNCLAVKLGAEVADLSEPMRLALERGTSRIIDALAASISSGIEERSIKVDESPQRTAFRLYALWLGASVMAKITRTTAPFDEALLMTETVLNHPD